MRSLVVEMTVWNGCERGCGRDGTLKMGFARGCFASEFPPRGFSTMLTFGLLKGIELQFLKGKDWVIRSEG